MRLKSLILLWLLPLYLLAAPAFSGWQECHLSDGTPVLLRLVGDEFYHYWETETGMLALEQPDGSFILTDEPIPLLSEQTRLRKAARPDAQPQRTIGKPTTPARGLVLLVQFADTKFKAANDSAAFVDMFNKAGYDYDGATGSAADYFKAQSNNQYQPVFDVFGPITLANDAVYYGEQGEKNGSTINDLYMADFVMDAVQAADSKGCDFSPYDGDNDGYVDIVYLVYAGRGQADGGATSTIWPHNWKVTDALYYGRAHSTVITGAKWLLKSFDGKKVNNYACSAELRRGEYRAGIGTFCHEFSHVLGLPDYYVTISTAANNGKNYTPGPWSVMDQGLYNNSGRTPPNYSVYDKYFMSWLTPKHLPKDKQTDVTVTADYTDVYQISGQTGTTAKSYKTTSRVWYLENRQHTGWDTYLPGKGLCVWEVVYNNSNWTDNKPNNETVGYTIVTAKSLTRPYTPYKDKSAQGAVCGTTFPGTSNVTSFTPAEGCALTAITEKSGIITFQYNGGTPLPTEYAYELIGDKCTVPADGVVLPNAPLELIITPDAGYTLADESCWMVEMGSTMLTYTPYNPSSPLDPNAFSYDASTSTFRIASVTGDVTILADAIVYTPTSIDNLAAPQSNDQRPTTIDHSLILQNGTLYLLRAGKLYTISGVLVR